MQDKRAAVFRVAKVVAALALAAGGFWVILQWRSDNARLMESRTTCYMIWSQLPEVGKRMRPPTTPESNSVVTGDGGVIGDYHWTIVWKISETFVNFQSPKSSVVRPIADLRIWWLSSSEQGAVVVIEPGEAPESEEAAEILSAVLEARGIPHCIATKWFPEVPIAVPGESQVKSVVNKEQ